MNTYAVKADCWATEEQALFGIYNAAPDPDMATRVEIRRIWIKEGAFTDGSSAAAWYAVSRISAAAGGTAWTATAFDKGYSLPSQVSILERPTSVTYDTPKDFRRFARYPLTTTYATIAGPHHRGGTWGRRSMSLEGVESHQFHKGANLPIELTEGYGMAIRVYIETQAPFPVSWFTTIILRDSTNSRTYAVSGYIAPTPGHEATLAIMNGSGSGITLQVVSIDMEQAGENAYSSTASNAPAVRFCRVIGLYEGESVTAVPYDKSHPMPSWLQAYRGGQTPLRVQLDTPGLSFDELQYTVNAARIKRAGTYANRMMYMGILAEPGLAMGFGSPIMSYKDCLNGLDCMGPFGQPITLRPGEGFAIMHSGNSGFCCYQIALTICTFEVAIAATRPENVFMS